MLFPEHEVGGFCAELQPEAAAFERVHRGRAPWSVETLAGSTDHRTPAVGAADPGRHRRHRRDDDDAFGLLQQLLRDVIRDVEDLLHHDAAVRQPSLFLLPTLCRSALRR